MDLSRFQHVELLPAANEYRHFLDEAIAQGLADEDKDTSITAIELSQYLHERYRSDVKSVSTNVVRTEMTLGYQHLVVDRGSIGAYDILAIHGKQRTLARIDRALDRL